MDLKLEGRKAIVTGGTRGIGRAIVDTLAGEGCAVALCARTRGQVDETVATLQQKGVKASGGAVDVADTKALRSWIDDTVKALGGLDIFIANVSALAMGMDEESWRRSLDIDIMGTVFGCEAALPALEKSGEGAIVVIGTTGLVEIAGPTRPYASVKAARWGEWGRRKRSPTPRCSWRARARASSAAPTSSSTARSRNACSTEASP